MDLKDAFFRISVPTKWRSLTAFSCNGKDYQFRRMPFGLKTAPSTFQRFMDWGLKDHKNYTCVYMDDILVHAPSREELIARTARVKKTLAKMKCTVNEEKSDYTKQGLLFAGLWIYHGGQGPNQAKVASVLATPTPRTKEQKQSALGLVSYLRDHVPLASHFTASLSERKEQCLSEKEYEEEWTRLKRQVARHVTTLGEWDDAKEADVYTDASNTSCAALLIQSGRIIALASRKLNPAETRYSATDREQLGLLLAAKKFRPFLHRPMGQTRVWSDHAALLTRKTADMTPRQARWHTIVNQWIPNVAHVKGKSNPADFFSRWATELPGAEIRV